MELQRALRAAKEAEAAKLTFFKAMDHEFRTPIGIIIGFSDILAAATERGAPEPRQISYLGDIRSAAHHLLMMVEDVRRYLRITSPTDLKRERVFLAKAIEGAAHRVEPVLHGLGAKLHIAVSEQVAVSADLPLLQQALANLIAELARRAARAADVAVEICPSEDLAVAEVRCPSLILPEGAFSGPNQLHGCGDILNRGLEGAGVGLVVAERIIRFHGGELRIRSDAGSGTAIRVALPRDNNPAE
ncbi:sensor histidine kinase [Pararoseomonas baculiformis]|nr:HAMP domain-containing sensor histidine kinase [Pararoseomonas baculiformis]